jgi:hypothetical protein
MRPASIIPEGGVTSREEDERSARRVPFHLFGALRGRRRS